MPLPKSPAAATSSNGLRGFAGHEGTTERKPGRGRTDLSKRSLDEADVHGVGGEHGWPVAEVHGPARLGAGKRRRAAQSITDLAGNQIQRAGARHLDATLILHSCLEQGYPPAGTQHLHPDRQGRQRDRTHELRGEASELQRGRIEVGFERVHEQRRASTAVQRPWIPRSPRRLGGHEALAIAYKHRVPTHRGTP